MINDNEVKKLQTDVWDKSIKPYKGYGTRKPSPSSSSNISSLSASSKFCTSFCSTQMHTKAQGYYGLLEKANLKQNSYK